MNIVIFTNTFTPHVGGVARSVQAFTRHYRNRGHRVLTVAPEFKHMPEDETDVIRIPAIQNFNASDFSVALPVPAGLTEALEDFDPDIIHSQHPFLLGMTAVRMARYLQRPLVFTHHTLYEQYTHYVPGDSPLFKRFIIELATHYANLADQVFAPSESIRDLLLERGVTVPVRVVPTGVEVENFSNGDCTAFRRQRGIPDDAFVVGHLGRLAPEKNLEFLAEAVAGFVREHAQAHFIVVGTGPSEPAIREAFARAGCADRLQILGTLEKQELADALNGMDVFAFASHSETQGMVLTEAMAAGLPVVALDATGAREVVRDQVNGRLLQQEDTVAFAAALEWIHDRPAQEHERLVNAARATAEEFSMARSADNALECFEALSRQAPEHSREEESAWEQVRARIKAEWDILRSLTRAGDGALSDYWSDDKHPE
ncbi:glycosyltransferase [Thiohalobacter thiocyanaticus]|uniref:Glycosyltransferase family 4 protein n=1 Tax=Thiohalobacter thiocyanaticus TaxID=585455 RepID=A0A426QLX6_9GAMM|nr:glycosyltransferase [Thiohalobacter thiocyanaticus]RRQ22761.1 glycosyltransferase family 4 protein [Thiohalobacter thiocyanaticus]